MCRTCAASRAHTHDGRVRGGEYGGENGGRLVDATVALKAAEQAHESALEALLRAPQDPAGRRRRHMYLGNITHRSSTGSLLFGKCPISAAVRSLYVHGAGRVSLGLVVRRRLWWTCRLCSSGHQRRRPVSSRRSSSWDLAVCLTLWLAYSLHMMRAYAHSQVDRGGGMSVAGAAIRAACGKRVDLAAVAYFFLVFHLCQGISQELAEYTRGASERPLWNLFEGGGAEVLLLFQLLGAALEAGAHLEAELGGRGRVALRRAGASAAFIRSPPFLVWVALGVGWDLLLVCEYFDEEGEPLAANPNRERARLCAVAGVVKTVGEVIIAAMYP